MGVPRCRLICHSSVDHLTQLYTGFGMLAKAGVIELDVERAGDYSARNGSQLTVILNDTYRLFYDVADKMRVYTRALEECDHYFKRSFCDEYVETLGSRKIYPLGFNYPVYGDGDFALRRVLWSLQSVRSWQHLRFTVFEGIRASYILSGIIDTRVAGGRATSRVDQFEGVPRLSETPRVVLLTRLWEPPNRFSEGCPRSAARQAEERHTMNSLRVACIRMLRREFGESVVAGLAPTAYARKEYSDCVVDDPELTRKGTFLRLVREADICVVTRGTQGSNGWRLGESVAAGKAIVSETLQRRVPGDFTPEKNYLPFGSAEECVERVHQLFHDPTRRYEMMKQNHDYYHAYLRPDILVLNTLARVLEHAL